LKKAITCPKCGEQVERKYEYWQEWLGVVEYSDECPYCGYWEKYAYGQYRGTDWPELEN